MKMTITILMLLLAVFLSGCSTMQDSADVSDNAVADKIPPKSFEAKVLKVLSAKYDTAIFRAYLVMWKDQVVRPRRSSGR